LKAKNKKTKSTRSKPEPLELPRGLQINKGPYFDNLEDVTPIVEFLENYRQLVDPRAQLPLKLISLKVSEPLLAAFRYKATRMNVPYQTMIKRLMQQWLQESKT
jgi:hypothetical protein